MADWKQRDLKRQNKKRQSSLDKPFKSKHQRQSQSELERERRAEKTLQRAIENEFAGKDNDENQDY